MSYLLIEDALDLLEDAVDEGLHDHMAVYCVLDDGGNFSALATSEGFVPMTEIYASIRSAFKYYATQPNLGKGE